MSVDETLSNARRLKELSNCQQGAVSLFMGMIVLALITIVAIYTSRAIVLETKIQGNDLRAKQAFEAAEAGFQDAIRWLSEDYDTASQIDVDYYEASGADFKSDSLGNGSRFEVKLSPIGDGRFSILSKGFSDDDRAYHVVRSEARPGFVLPNPPGVPITSRGEVNIKGSATIYNHEGHSTIWSGKNIALGSNNATATYVADPTDSNYPSCMDKSLECKGVKTSTKTTGVGLDGVENDADLWGLGADGLFKNYFGKSIDAYISDFENSGNYVYIDAATSGFSNTDINKVTGSVIYIKGDVTVGGSAGGLTVGCSHVITGQNADGDTHPKVPCNDSPSKPSILIVDGNLTTKGQPAFQGLVFVTGSLSAGGNASVQGALIVAGDTQTSTSGSLDIWYDSEMLKNLKNIGGFSGTSGTWRDWP